MRLTALSIAAGRGTGVAAAELYLQGVPHVQAAAVCDRSRPRSWQPRRRTRPWSASGDRPSASRSFPWPLPLLPNNEMLVWSADQALAYGGSNDPYTQTAILNLTTGAVSEDTVTNTGHNMFCPGVAILPNGDIMVTGGISNQQTSIYDPTTNLWTAGPP